MPVSDLQSIAIDEPKDLETDPTGVSTRLLERDINFLKTDEHRIRVSWRAFARDGSAHECDRLFFAEYDEALDFLRSFYSHIEGFGHSVYLSFYVQDVDEESRWSRRDSKVY